MTSDKLVGLGLEQIKREAANISTCMYRLLENTPEEKIDVAVQKVDNEVSIHLAQIDSWLRALQDIYPDSQ